MTSDHVYCESCDNVCASTRDVEKPWRFRCIKFPVASGFGFVSATYSPTPPYARCIDKNPVGLCPHFTPIRQAEAQS
jgi:hypothetical protein